MPHYYGWVPTSFWALFCQNLIGRKWLPLKTFLFRVIFLKMDSVSILSFAIMGRGVRALALPLLTQLAISVVMLGKR